MSHPDTTREYFYMCAINCGTPVQFENTACESCCRAEQKRFLKEKIRREQRFCCPYCMSEISEEHNYCCGEAGHGGWMHICGKCEETIPDCDEHFERDRGRYYVCQSCHEKG